MLEKMGFNLRKNQEEKPNKPKTEILPDSAKNLLEPKLVEINGYKFVISKMPCTVAQEVIYKIPTGLIPLLSNFSQAEEMAFKMLSYCSRVYPDDRGSVQLVSKVVIDNHVPDFSTLTQLEAECLKYNYDFFEHGRAWTFCQKALSHVESKTSEILTVLLDKLLQAEKQPYTNSKQSTH